MIKHVVLGICVLLTVSLPASAETRVVPSNRELIHLSFAPIVKKVAPAVVNVFSRRTVRTAEGFSALMNDPFFRQFLGDRSPFGVPRQRVESSLGSGVLLDAKGLIVTNHHVIKDAEEVTVVLSDRREFDAKILLSDERADLAVLRIDPHGETLPILEIGDSDQLEVGDLVLAVGNPFGVGQTVTSGIVSGLARTAVGISDFRSFIQTDAAINPGNSGGALVDLDGRLIGINTAIFSQSGGSVGIGFAIPTNMVRIMLQAATSGGKIVRPWLGASGQGVTADIAQSLGLPHPEGVLVKDVAPGSPAAQAGIHTGDVIVEVDGHAIEDPEGLRFRIATLALSAEVKLKIWRSGRDREVVASLSAPPDQPPRQPTPLTGRHPMAGMTVANLNPAFAEELGLETTIHGVVITMLERGSIAARVGFQPGDILVSVNKKPVENVSQLNELINGTATPWVVTIRRGGETLSTPPLRG